MSFENQASDTDERLIIAIEKLNGILDKLMPFLDRLDGMMTRPWWGKRNG